MYMQRAILIMQAAIAPGCDPTTMSCPQQGGGTCTGGGTGGSTGGGTGDTNGSAGSTGGGGSNRVVPVVTVLAWALVAQVSIEEMYSLLGLLAVVASKLMQVPVRMEPPFTLYLRLVVL